MYIVRTLLYYSVDQANIYKRYYTIFKVYV